VTVIEYVHVPSTPPSAVAMVSVSVPWAPVLVTMMVTEEVDAPSMQFSVKVPLSQLWVQPAGAPPSPAPASPGYVSVVVPASGGQLAELFAPAVTVSVYVPSAGVQLLFEPLLDPLELVDPLLEPLELVDPLLDPLELVEPLLEPLLLVDPLLEPLLLLPDEDEHATDPVPIADDTRIAAPKPMY
jgi:hypothetical protein